MQRNDKTIWQTSSYPSSSSSRFLLLLLPFCLSPHHHHLLQRLASIVSPPFSLFFVLLFRFEFINALKFEYEMVFSSSSSSSFVLLKTKNSRRRRRRRREEEFQRLFRNSYRRSGRLRIRHHRRLLSFFLSLFLTFLHL